MNNAGYKDGRQLHTYFIMHPKHGSILGPHYNDLLEVDCPSRLPGGLSQSVCWIFKASHRVAPKNNSWIKRVFVSEKTESHGLKGMSRLKFMRMWPSCFCKDHHFRRVPRTGQRARCVYGGEEETVERYKTGSICCCNPSMYFILKENKHLSIIQPGRESSYIFKNQAISNSVWL